MYWGNRGNLDFHHMKVPIGKGDFEGINVAEPVLSLFSQYFPVC